MLRMIYAGYTVHSFKFTLHTHSHIALLGWLYNLFLILLMTKEPFKEHKGLRINFVLSQVTFAGMLVSFPVQGYGLFSISFSTAYLFCSYHLIWLIFRNTRASDNPEHRYWHWGGFYLFLSSLGPYALGYFMAKDMGNTIWYPLSIYWFLHFLYNGFFMMIFFGHFFRHLDRKKVSRVFHLLNWSIIPLFLHSVIWLETEWWVNMLAFVPVAMQLAAVGIGFQAIREVFRTKSVSGRLIQLALIALMLKVFFQLLYPIPPVQDFINATKPFTVVGFIHLVMLGFFSLYFLGEFKSNALIRFRKAGTAGLILLITGIISSEFTLFGQGFLGYYFHTGPVHLQQILLIVSSLIPLGILMIFLDHLTSKHKKTPTQ